MTTRPGEKKARLRCCHQNCGRPARRHHWGHGFAFYERHMGRLEELARNRPSIDPTSRKEASPWKSS